MEKTVELIYRVIMRLKYAVNRLKRKGLLNVISAVVRKYNPKSELKGLVELARFFTQKSDVKKYRIIQLETIAGCNYSCSFCPIGKKKLPMGKMTDDTFDRIISQLSAFDGMINLFFRNEPLLDKRLNQLVEKIKNATKAEIVIQTNGSMLTEENYQWLSDRLTLIVNDYTCDNEIINRIKMWGTRDNVILVDRNDEEVLSNRAGNLPGEILKKYTGFCYRPFKEMTISYNGNVVLCCQDWSLESVMGNVNESTLDEIWYGKRYRDIRNNLLKNERLGLCAKCDFPGV